MNHYYNNYCMEEIETTGDTIRRKNHLKMKNLMAMAVNFLDYNTLDKLKKEFYGLSPEDMAAFKEYLNNRGYLSRKNTSENKRNREIANKIAQIIFSSVPKDKTLKKYYDEYNKNLKNIDKLKQMMSKSDNSENLNDMFKLITVINDKNIEIMQKIDAYRSQVFG